MLNKSQFKVLGQPKEQINLQPYKLPEGFQQMYTDHSYYHLIKNHYNCFGFNIFDIEQSRKLKIDIFGGIEEMKDWKSYAFINKKKSDHDTQHQQNSVVDENWLLIASSSEFDYYFLQIDPSRPDWGTVRHVVNNMAEENDFSLNFQEFVQKVQAIIDQYFKENSDKEEDINQED